MGVSAVLALNIEEPIKNISLSFLGGRWEELISEIEGSCHRDSKFPRLAHVGCFLLAGLLHKSVGTFSWKK